MWWRSLIILNYHKKIHTCRYRCLSCYLKLSDLYIIPRIASHPMVYRGVTSVSDDHKLRLETLSGPFQTWGLNLLCHLLIPYEHSPITLVFVGTGYILLGNKFNNSITLQQTLKRWCILATWHEVVFFTHFPTAYRFQLI